MIPALSPRIVAVIEVARTIPPDGWHEGLAVVDCPRCNALCGCVVTGSGTKRQARTSCPLCGTMTLAWVDGGAS